jgi:hypothetical protein
MEVGDLNITERSKYCILWNLKMDLSSSCFLFMSHSNSIHFSFMVVTVCRLVHECNSLKEHAASIFSVDELGPSMTLNGLGVRILFRYICGMCGRWKIRTLVGRRSIE